MKNFWLFVVLCAVAGISVAWITNHLRFGFRDARLGYMTSDGEINASNIMNTVTSKYMLSGAKVEMLTDEMHDFGVMAPGDTGKYVFKVKNVGKEPLSLKEGSSTCKCTIGTLENNTLAPGEETEVAVEWTVETNKSEFSQSAQIITNDPSKVVLNLKVSGRVVRDIEIIPKMWSIGNVASGESFEVKGTVYNYYDSDIEPGKLSFSSKQMNELTDFVVEKFEPTDADGVNANARQGFNITAKVKGGLRQGAISTMFLFGFQRVDADGNYITPENLPESENEEEEDLFYYSSAEVSGRIAGMLSMIVGTKLQGKAGGGYVYNFGNLGYKDSKKAKAFVVLKGSERERTKLTIGEVSPAEAIQVNLGKPLIRKTQVLYPLEMEIIPGDKPYELTGKGAGNYGSIWIESDNPKVTKMLVAVKFAVDAK